MAIAIQPRIQVKISGDSICLTDQIKAWDLSQKMEIIKSIKADDNEVTIDFSDIENMELIEFYSADPFNIILTITTTGISPTTNMIEIPITGFFVLNTDQTFIDTLTTLQISTDSTTDITVNINAYGTVA